MPAERGRGTALPGGVSVDRDRGLVALQNYAQGKNVVIGVGRSSPGPDMELNARVAGTSAT